jgi:hypothetical protein
MLQRYLNFKYTLKVLLQQLIVSCEFIILGGYLNFRAQFMKSVLLGQKRIKSWNKWHSVENKRDYATCHKNAVNFLVAWIHKMDLGGGGSYMHLCMWMQFFKWLVSTQHVQGSTSNCLCYRLTDPCNVLVCTYLYVSYGHRWDPDSLWTYAAQQSYHDTYLTKA